MCLEVGEGVEDEEYMDIKEILNEKPHVGNKPLEYFYPYKFLLNVNIYTPRYDTKTVNCNGCWSPILQKYICCVQSINTGHIATHKF